MLSSFFFYFSVVFTSYRYYNPLQFGFLWQVPFNALILCVLPEITFVFIGAISFIICVTEQLKLLTKKEDKSELKS